MRSPRWFAAVLFVLTPALSHANQFQIASGTFSVSRPLIGTMAGWADFGWLNPPTGAFETAARHDLEVVSAVWSPDTFSTSLLGGTAPVSPLPPGPVPVGGVFLGRGASFLFVGKFPDAGVPFLDTSATFEFSGGSFNVPSSFPPTDDEGLYIMRSPFSMKGTWTVLENGSVLFDGPLSGSGVASLVLGADRTTGRSVISGIYYDFDDTAPVPEPGTLTLVGLGAVLAAARRSRSRRPGRTRGFGVAGRTSLPLVLAMALCTIPSFAEADSVAVRGSMGIWSHGGDAPDIPEPLREFLFYFAPQPPNGLPGVEWMWGEAYATSPPHGSIGGLVMTRPAEPGALEAGASFNLSTGVAWTAGGMHDDFIAGCCFDSVYYATSGAFDMIAGTALLEMNGDQIVGRAPFRFSGLVNAFDPMTGAALFQRQLRGNGQATFYTYRSRPDFFAYVYDVEPVPEPGTLILVASGLALAARAGRRRQQHGARPMARTSPRQPGPSSD